MSTSGPVWWEERSARVSQAAGMISAQAACSIDAALLLLKLRASAMNRDLEETATAVVEGRIHFNVQLDPLSGKVLSLPSG